MGVIKYLKMALDLVKETNQMEDEKKPEEEEPEEEEDKK